MVKLKKINNKKQSFLNFIIILFVIFILNYFSSFFSIRYDLTSEKRYTLSPITKSILKKLNENIYFEVYLDGDLPSGFKRLQKQIREMLNEFRANSDKVNYGFVNPLRGKNAREQQRIIQYLSDKGLQVTDLQVKTFEGTEQKLIVPGAILGDGKQEISIGFLQNQIGVRPETILNNSIQMLEFKLINAINKLTQKVLPSIALLAGHGELDYPYLVDIALALNEDYRFYQIRLDGDIKTLFVDSANTFWPKFDAIIIAKPIKRFDEKDKFVIDQFIMHGGNVFWLIDPVLASLDSLMVADKALTYPYNLNLEDMLFKYGVRLNQNLIMDINALPIPLKTGQIGNQPQINFFSWPFYPIIHPTADHPIVRNLNAIKTEFVSSLDTLAINGIRKTILLKTSNRTNILTVPHAISLDMIDEKLQPDKYQSGSQNIAVLLEGSFSSVFKNRFLPVDVQGYQYLEKGENAKMLILSDGDVIKNQIHSSNNEPLPLGYDQYTNQTFGNKEFILNVLNYLTGGSDLIKLRSREVKLRLLDKAKIREKALFWKFLNTTFPVFVIIVFAIFYHIIRKRRYTHYR